MKNRIVLSILLLSLTTGCLAAAPQTDDNSSFSITPSYKDKEIFDLHERLKEANKPQFITTDLTLHAAHLLFDYSLRAIELEKLYPLAETLCKTMAQESAKLDLMQTPTGPSVTAFFLVPAKITDPEFTIADLSKEILDAVKKDLAAIEKHEGFQFSAALDNAEDFSQYVPRGHYTRNESFKRYFKAMMWFGRRMFRIEEVRATRLPDPCNPDHWSKMHQKNETLMMLKITWMLHNVKIDGEPAMDVWRKLYIPTTLFAGRTEDLNPEEVKALATKVWGSLPTPKGLAALKPDKLAEFIKLAKQKSRPKIDSSGAGRKGFCFMGQRFTPDSYIMQCLVTGGDTPFGDVPEHPLGYTGDRTPKPFTWGVNRYMRPPERRFMPRGLDVFAVFGSEEALAILKEEGDTAYKGYNDMLAFLRKDVGAMMQQRKEENLYYAWLYALQPLLKTPEGKSVPGFLKTNAWTRKSLATGLASWAELRHDTILYVKQSYTPTARSMPPRPRVTPGYVEPYPAVYTRIAAMIKKMRTDLGTLGVMPKGLENNYKQFETICGKLAAISQKELNGEKLTDEEYLWIASVAMQLKSSTRLPYALRRKILSGTDSHMAIIADVHTDNNSKSVLEEAVGTPFVLTVNMRIDGKMTTLSGAVFSYYEFKHPMKDRLTDEAWQEMLKKTERPALPAWLPLSKPTPAK